MNTENTKELLALGAKLVGLSTVPGTNIPFAVVPEGYELKSLAEHLSQPVEIKQNITLNDVDSFTAYLGKFALRGRTVVFSDLASLSMTAVIDYHDGAIRPDAEELPEGFSTLATTGIDVQGPAQWGRHVVHLQLLRAPEFDAWAKHNDNMIPQVQFADFLERHAGEIVRPDAATMLEVAKTLYQKSKIVYVSSENLQNGDNRLTYQEESESGAGAKGTIDIPSNFQIGVRIFRYANPFGIDCLYRYRVDKDTKKLFMCYVMVDFELILERALANIASKVSEQLESKLPGHNIAFYTGKRG
jgi:hypothetical protein